MSQVLKSLAAAVLVASVSACAVVPAPYPSYGYGARVDVVTVRSAPAYRGEPHYGDGWGHHHRHRDDRW